MHPQSIDHDAPIIGRHRALTAAPLSVVWRLHTEISVYPTWQPQMLRAYLDGPLVPGARFGWTTESFEVDSVLFDLEPERRTLWGGTTAGIRGIHGFTFTTVDQGVLIETEESWDGEPVRADPQQMQGYLDADLAGWLQRFVATAEAQAG
ncbi:MAG: hypothetical protein ABIM89_18650 [Mycobacteriales bacterium]